MKLTVSIKDIKKKTNDSTYLPSVIHVQNASGGWDSVKVSVRARGFFRRKTCYFTPLRIKIAKGDAKGTLFEGNKSLKLVLPCQNNDIKDELILKEFICYKMDEVITPYHFKTRRIKLEFTDGDGKKNNTYPMTAFFIEDDDLVAKRHHAKVVENMNLHPLALNDTASLQHDLFQYLVANTDWSTTFMHNAKVIFKEPRKYIPLAYDFDMAGFVDAPYATANADLGISSVRERLYRGFCRNEATVQYVRKQFIDNERAILAVVDSFEKEFNARDFKEMKGYLDEFFTVMKDNTRFKSAILEKCRRK